MKILEECLALIRLFGDKVYNKSDETLMQELQWYYANDRLAITLDNNEVVGVIGFLPVNSASFLATGEFPDQDIFGKLLYVPFAVIRPDHQHQNIMNGWLVKVIVHFPNVEHVLYEISGVKTKIIHINYILSGGLNHGRGIEDTRSAKSATTSV